MVFLNARLPEDVERGAQGGPSFSTTILELQSGFEQRNINWEYPRLEWDLSYGIQSKSDLQSVMNAYYVAQGRGHSFRFKDYSDYQVGDDANDTPVSIFVASGGETQVQAIKPYSFAGSTFNRALTRLVTGTVRVFIDAVEQTITTDFTVDVETGVITFLSALSAAEVVGLICEFDVPVRFNDDKLDVRMEWEDALEIPRIPIREIRETLVSI